MGEKRLVDQRLFHSPDLLKLPISGRYLWVGLVVMCDRNGLIRHDLGFIRALVMPSSRISTTLLEHYLSFYQTSQMLSSCICDGVKYLKINNFKLYHKHRRSLIGEERTRLDRRGEENESKPESPLLSILSEIPEGGSLKERWMLHLAAFGLPFKDRDRASRVFEDLKPTEQDLTDWRECYALACRRAVRREFPLYPRAYIKKCMLRFACPGRADIGWWRERDRLDGPNVHRKDDSQPRASQTPSGAMSLSELSKAAEGVKVAKK